VVRSQTSEIKESSSVCWFAFCSYFIQLALQLVWKCHKTAVTHTHLICTNAVVTGLKYTEIKYRMILVPRYAVAIGRWRCGSMARQSVLQQNNNFPDILRTVTWKVLK